MTPTYGTGKNKQTTKAQRSESTYPRPHRPWETVNVIAKILTRVCQAPDLNPSLHSSAPRWVEGHVLSGVEHVAVGGRGVGEPTHHLQSWDETTGRSVGLSGSCSLPQLLMTTLTAAGQSKIYPLSREGCGGHGGAFPT